MKKYILAADIGNTSTHFILCSEGGRIHKEFRIATPEIKSRARQVISKNIPAGSETVVLIASVVPSAEKLLRDIVSKQLKRLVYTIGREIQVPIKNLYKRPSQVGVDRLLNAYAGYAEHKRELIILDFGTAITFDLVSRKGDYLGGIIAPGIEISLEALFQKTALLPKIRLAHPASLIGRDTTESIRVGCTVGIGGLCDRIVEALSVKHFKKPLVIATGGYAHFMKRYCHSIQKIDDRLVLRGMLQAYRHFLKKKLTKNS